MKILAGLLVSFAAMLACLGCSQQATVADKPKDDRAIKDVPKLPAPPTPGTEDLVK